MVYIVDAQLPRKLVNWLKRQGYDAVHTLDLPDKNETEDIEIIRVSTELPDSVIVTKDRDFPEYRLIHGRPQRLLWVTTGNIANVQLLDLFERNFSKIDRLFVEGSNFIELTNTSIVVH